MSFITCVVDHFEVGSIKLAEIPVVFSRWTVEHPFTHLASAIFLHEVCLELGFSQGFKGLHHVFLIHVG